MAVYVPSRAFEGSDLSTSIFGKIIKDGVRTVNFRDEKNKEGSYFFILPPYKEDSGGRGVSWKVIPVRDNFGIDVKEVFPVPRNCPVAYLASRAKQFYQDYARVEQVTINNKLLKRYPAFGRPTNKVIFNVAYMNAMHLGAHVLTLPQFGGAEHIEAWGRRRMSDNTEAPLLNNPDMAIPVFIQLKRDAVGQPWVVTPEPSKVYKLPNELADADYLYNLDDVVAYPEIEYLIDKLRSFVPTDIFNRCMVGYQMPNGSIIGSVPPPSPTPATQNVQTGSAKSQPVAAMPSFAQNQGLSCSPPITANPGFTQSQPVLSPPLPIPSVMPRATVPQVAMPTMTPSEPPMPSMSTTATANPTAGPVFTVEQARAYLAQTTRTN